MVISKELSSIRIKPWLLFLALTMGGCASGPAFEKVDTVPMDKASNKSPDDSLCDLGPNTTEVLSRKILVPPPIDDRRWYDGQWAEAYARLAARFVVSSCSNGQVLILHTENTRPLDAAYLPLLASALCLEADSTLTERSTKSTKTGEQQRRFELRCKITKFGKFKADLERLEKRESTETLIGRLQAQPRSP